MNYKKGKVTIRSFLQALTLYFFIGLSVAMFLLDSIYPSHFMFLRKSVSTIISPIMYYVFKPISSVSDSLIYINELEHMDDLNNALKQRVRKLQHYKNIAIELERENNQFRKILKYTNHLEKEFIIARVIGDTGGLYTRSLLLDRGEKHGIKENDGVMSSGNLLGRIIEVSSNSSRILLLTDLNSALPVVIDGTEENAILMGNSSEFPSLKFIRKLEKIKIGQRIITSGYGGLFPPGILVGKIKDIKGVQVNAEIFAHVSSSLYVKIIKFNYKDKPIEK